MPVTPAAAKAPPPYLILRYDEDYRWLDAPAGTYATDWSDKLKNIHLGGDWRLSIGGEIRGRFEMERNKLLSAPDQTKDSFFLHRYFLWADVRHGQWLRVFVEGEQTMSEGVDLYPLAPTYDNRWDLKQGFVDLSAAGEGIPLTLRTGRQELLYGKQRLISPLMWSNVQRRFDGLKLLWRTAELDVDAFWVRPVDTSPALGRDRSFDHYDEDTDFLGVYATWKKIPRHKLEGYFLTLLRNDPPLNANGRGEQLQLYTVGGRAEGKRGNWDYEGEAAFQTGNWGGDQVGAWMVAAETGYTLREWPFSPRGWIAFDYASGDANPNDRKVGTFNQLFPLGHAFFGYADLFARQNVIDPHFGVSLQLTKRLSLSAEQHFFWLAERTDALYGVTGAPSRRDATGGSGRIVGHEIDLVARYVVDRHSALEMGLSRFEGDNYLRSTGIEEPVTFFYVQYQMKF